MHVEPTPTGSSTRLDRGLLRGPEKRHPNPKVPMRNHSLLVGALLLLTACSVPFRTSTEERKSACDRIAARAIQTSSLEEAKNLAAQASECYARAQG